MPRASLHLVNSCLQLTTDYSFPRKGVAFQSLFRCLLMPPQMRAHLMSILLDHRGSDVTFVLIHGQGAGAE